MIFNSISSQIHKHSYQQKTSQASQPSNNKYFPYKNTYQKQESSNPSYYHNEVNPSPISQMNEQISANLQFLRYKRYEDLKSSQISHKSNHSAHSVKYNHYSPSKSTSSYRQKQLENNKFLYEPIINNVRPSKQAYINNAFPQNSQPYYRNMKTPQPQPYYHQIKTSQPQQIRTQASPKLRSQYIPEKNHEKKHEYTLNKQKSSFLNDQQNNQYKQFARKSVILQDRPSILRGSMHYHHIEPSRDYQDQSVHSNYSDKFSAFSKELHSQENRTSDIATLILSNKENRPKSKIREVQAKLQSTEKMIKIQDKGDAVEMVSPLPVKSKRNDSLILSAGLIALGIIIFLLQILK